MYCFSDQKKHRLYFLWVFLVMLIFGLWDRYAKADDKFFLGKVSGKEISKVEALKAGINDQNAPVIRCQDMEVNHRGSLVKK